MRPIYATKSANNFLKKTGYLAFFSAFFLAGCQPNMDDLVQYVERTKMRTDGYVEPIPPFPEYESFTYYAEGLRDPFNRPEQQASTAANGKTDGPRPDEDRVREHLEQYPLDTLRMVGGLQKRKTLWGLIRDADGTIHRVQPGNYAGLNHGKIKRVTDTQIDIVELIDDGTGQWIERDAQLTLSEGDENK